MIEGVGFPGPFIIADSRSPCAAKSNRSLSAQLVLRFRRSQSLKGVSNFVAASLPGRWPADLDETSPGAWVH